MKKVKITLEASNGNTRQTYSKEVLIQVGAVEKTIASLIEHAEIDGYTNFRRI